MITLTKVFHFEMAHAIHGYPGNCKNVHGHSYELHVTVSPANQTEAYIKTPGYLVDFKEIKKLVKNAIVDQFDHKLLLSQDFLQANPNFASQENLVQWEVEPTAENLLIYIQHEISNRLDADIRLSHLRLFETVDSYADWTNTAY